ncbi:hypothetical protein PR003_g14964 [Phytophthora rubi]|uniref:Uncharacterized protein n=1 Tax=Phytophthora rubi TaxID=129364 RepID=A0A6A3MNX1_9STRA|nr:hypothetical protein PR002_g8838 [Phytophthora rubi]KAE9331543.1 hypothetical protein PR003_g14964 [Phytophthora rubi]
MAEAPRGDEVSNPFDAPTSDRDPFPPFEAALADDQPTTATAEGEGDKSELQGAGSVLDWSIDTLAELKPVMFSPLPQQKDANVSGTPHGASGFFEDEKQYEVLRTPLPATRPSTAAAASRSRSRATMTTTTTSPSPPLELHRRCRETIARCEARLRERQRKMDKLQAALPPPTPKRSPRQRSSLPSRSTPPRPAKRNRLSSIATPSSDWKSRSPSTRPPMWSASPIALVGSRQSHCVTPATLHFDAMTPSPQQSSKLRLSFGLSPIAFPSPEQMRAAKVENWEEGKDDEEKGASSEDTLPLSSTEESAASVSPQSEKENGEQQTQREGDCQQGSSSSHACSSMPAAKKSVPPARRQQAFMEAMEAEARSSEPSSGRRSPPLSAAASSSILSLYQEAKRLRMTDPEAQWQYVQTLRQSAEETHAQTITCCMLITSTDRVAEQSSCRVNAQ